jgi:hypothetical protein
LPAAALETGVIAKVNGTFVAPRGPVWTRGRHATLFRDEVTGEAR